MREIVTLLDARMSKLHLPEYIVVPDTNALRTDSIGHIANSAFESPLTNFKKITRLRLMIPDLVRQELIMQKFFSAQKSRANAKKNLDNIATITKTKARGLYTDSHLKKKINGTFEKWAKDHGAQVIKTPITKIKWKTLINAAVLRLPPFNPPSENEPSTEKGFRDALILETLMEIVRRYPQDHIVFLTSDRLLKEAAEARFQTNEKRYIFDTLLAFGDRLKLWKEAKSKEFIQLLLSRVKEVFYKENDPNCVYFKLKISSTISQKFNLELNFPSVKSKNPSTFSFEHLFQKALWKPSGDNLFYIFDTNLENIDSKKGLCWSTRVECVRRFKAESSSALGWISEQIRVTQVDVKWCCQVSEEAAFSSDYVLDDLKLVETGLEPLTLDHRIKYNMPFFDPTSLDFTKIFAGTAKSN